MRRHALCRLVLSALLVAAAAVNTASAQETVVQPADSARDRAQTPISPQPPADGQTQPPPSSAPGAQAAQTPPTPTAEGARPATAQGATSLPESTTKPTPPQVPAAAERPVAHGTRVPSYQARAVVAPPPDQPLEEQRIGEYRQPRWTAHRRFPTTRLYVRPGGQLSFEWWLETKQSLKDADAARYRSQFEFEMGLGHRLQLDLYLQTEQQGHQAPLELKAEKLELRWAIADWGVVPLNPTLYIEYVRQHDGPPKVELKGLLGDELAPRWHFGFNLVYEHELGGELESEYAAVTGLSYTLVDSRVSLGAEVKLETVDVAGERLTFDAWELLVGPSLAWTPTPAMHVLFVALLGSETEGDETTALLEPTLVLGWEI